MAKWQFQDFCRENPKTNEYFEYTVEKMITIEEKTQERLPDGNNYLDRQNHHNNDGMPLSR